MLGRGSNGSPSWTSTTVGGLGRTVVFGPELKVLARHPAWQGEIDRNAVAQWLRQGYVGLPRTMWKNVRKVGPGRS